MEGKLASLAFSFTTSSFVNTKMIKKTNYIRSTERELAAAEFSTASTAIIKTNLTENLSKIYKQ